MVLKGKRVILRKFKEDDASEYFKIAHEKYIKKYVSFASPKNIYQSIDLVNHYSLVDFINDFYFVIEDIKTGKMIGTIMCYRTLDDSLNTSYFIGNNFRNNGYCYEALEVLIEYLANNTNYNSLSFVVDNTNKCSRRLMRKICARRVHVFSRNSFYEYQIKSAK